jgi:hypothetical protein
MRALFWQEESNDHLVRSDNEFDRIRDYLGAESGKGGLGGGGRGASVVKRIP